MSSRMDKYVNNEDIPTRSNKNKELYKQIYNAYDEFENLIVPSNAREINISDLKKEITSREEYREKKVKHEDTSEQLHAEEDKIYDINELINKAVSEKRETPDDNNAISNGDYLKKLKLDTRKTNIEQVKEIYDDIKEEFEKEDDELLKTANLSLEILSDLKSDNDATKVSAPIKSEELPDDMDDSFYSTKYKFSKRDFEDNESNEEEKDDEEEEEDDDVPTGNGKFFFKILLLIFGIILVIWVLVYFINYFNRV